MNAEKKPEPGPIARRLAALNPKPAEPWKPAWMKNLTPKDMSGATR